MKDGFMKDYVVRECINILRREDIKDEVKSFMKPLISMLMEQIYPYVIYVYF